MTPPCFVIVKMTGEGDGRTNFILGMQFIGVSFENL